MTHNLKIWEPQHDLIYPNLCYNLVCYNGTALYFAAFSLLGLSLFFSLHYRDNPLTIIPRRNSDTSRSMYAGTTRSSPRTRTLDNPESPVLVIRSNTRSKSVASTLQRTEQLHDRLYEL